MSKRSPAQKESDKSPKLQYVEFRWSVGGEDEVSRLRNGNHGNHVVVSIESTYMLYRSSVCIRHSPYFMHVLETTISPRMFHQVNLLQVYISA